MLLFFILVLLLLIISISILIITLSKIPKKGRITMTEAIKYGMTNEFVNSLRISYKKDDDLKEIIAKLLDKFGTHDYPIPVENILRAMGFSIFASNTLEPNISAFIAVDDKLIKDFNNNKIVVANKNDSVEHQRFAIAHEIAHWIFDCKDQNRFYDTYNTDTDHTNIPTEYRANKFAAELMMPTSDFIDYINTMKKNEGISNNEIINNTSTYFGAPKTAVARRLKETGFTDLLKKTGYEYVLEN